MKYFVENYDVSYQILTWNKTNPIPVTNNTWLPDIEYCLVFKEKGSPAYNDGYENKSKWYVSGINKKDKDLYNHPTIKPLELVERHLKHSCKKGMVVFDPFLGSGTTAVACKELGIDYLGFEINKDYYNIACDRLNGITQKDRKEMENKITLF
jgi:DNA modification methylase